MFQTKITSKTVIKRTRSITLIIIFLRLIFKEFFLCMLHNLYFMLKILTFFTNFLLRYVSTRKCFTFYYKDLLNSWQFIASLTGIFISGIYIILVLNYVRIRPCKLCCSHRKLINIKRILNFFDLVELWKNYVRPLKIGAIACTVVCRG